MDKGWSFKDPPNVAVFAHRLCVTGEKEILYVSHDEEDGAWQFLPGGVELDEKDALVVSLEKIVLLDPTIESLADMPCGHCATRQSFGKAWDIQRSSY